MYLKDLEPRLYTADLESGEEIRPDPGHGLICFFLTEHITDKKKIAETAEHLLRTGCRRFRFHGTRSPAWRRGTEEAAARLYPERAQKESVQLQAADPADWNTFIGEIRRELEEGTDDVLLLYDDGGALPGALLNILFGDPVYPDSP